MARRFAFLLLALSFSDAFPGGKPVKFDRHISLPNNPVFCMTQDERGFLWFGTKNGLLRFDGYDFEVFNSMAGDTTTINTDWVWSLYKDSEGNLWIGTGLGLNLWLPQENRFKKIDLPTGTDNTNSLIVRKVFEDRSGNLWIGTNRGLYTGTIHDHTFKKYELHFDLGQSKDFDIKEITEDLDGETLISSQYGIFNLENGKLSFKDTALNSMLTPGSYKDEVRAIYLDKSSRTYWVGTQSEKTPLIQYQVGREPGKIPLPGSIETNSVRVIRNFGDSKLWLGTMNGLICFDTATNEASTLLKYQSVRDIFRDRDGGTWIATYNDGIYYQSPRESPFTFITEYSPGNPTVEGKRQNVVNDIVQTGDDRVWMATEFGLKLYNPLENTFSLYTGTGGKQLIANNRIKCLAYDKGGKLWIGTFNGLASLDLNTNEIENFTSITKSENQGWTEIYDIVLLGREVWAGTNNRGLICLSPGPAGDWRISQYADHFNRSANHINALHISADSTIWIGSNAGLSAIDPRTRRFKSIGEGNYFFQQKNIVSIHQDKRGNLWLGTERSGLIYFDPVTFESLSITEKDGLRSDKIKALEIDDDQHVWVTTEEGLSKTRLLFPGDFSSISYETFDFSIQSEQGTPHFLVNSSGQTPGGDILFGTRHGLVRFSPAGINNEHWHPKVWVRDISINQQPVMTNSALLQRFGNVEELSAMELDHDESVLAVTFSSINYSQQDHLYYSYLLEGVDETWQVLDKRRKLSFSFLPPGEYELKLRASNSKQQWGDSFTSLKIKIHPPFYKSKMAFVLYAAIILFLLYLFYYYSSRWQKMKNQLVIEELDKNKEHELHQVKSEFFMNISHELKTPLMLILEPVEDLLSQKIENPGIRNRLRTVRRNAKKILSLADQIVDIRKIETSLGMLKVANYDILPFVKDISSGFNELSRLKNIDFDVLSNQDKIEVWFDKQMLDTAITNIISNAFKYTRENGEVTVSVNCEGCEPNGSENGEVHIIIEDNGKGIAKEDLAHLFDRFHHLSGQDKRLSIGDGIGLDLAKKVIDLHQGHIKVESLEENENAHGLTRITITLRLGKEHFDPAYLVHPGTHDVPNQDEKEAHPRPYNYDLIDLDDKNGSFLSSDQTILVIDGDTGSREQLQELFSDSYHVYEVSDGLEGWKLILDIVPSLVILAENTTTIDAHELCQRIKIDERTCHIPVVFLTPSVEAHGHAEFAADEYLEKPIDKEYLHNKVDYLVEQRERVRKQFEKNSILKPSQVSSYDEKLLNRAIEFIDENLSDPNLSVERISKEIGISRVHFYRKIKSLLSLSPNEFVRTYRIRKAGQLLQQKKLNVSDARMMVGFNDSDYFRSCFKKEYGLTPSEFIRKYNGSG